MEWKCFFAISAYILTAFDPVCGANGITNVMLADGLTPNEGRVEYDRSGNVRTSACGDGLSSQEASVICRQLGYEGANNIIVKSPFGDSTSIDQSDLNCDGDEETLANCSLLPTTFCSNAGGVICYESGYTGCYTYPGLAQGDLQNPCQNGLQNLTILKCVSLCHGSNDRYTFAGLYRGDTCLCGDSSTTVSQADRVDDNTDPRFCSSTCAGRNIESCGGESHIALFNITLYLQNTERTASPPGCAEPIPTQTEGDFTTTASIQSSSSTSPPATPPSTSSPASPSASSPSSSSSSSSSPPATPPSTSSPASPATPPSSSSPPSTATPATPPSLSSSPSSTRPTSPSVPSTDRITMEVMTSDVTPRSPTGMPATTTRTTPTGVQGNLGLYIGAGAGGGILLLIIILLLVVFIIRRRRRSKDKGSTGDHSILELRLRPEGSDLGDFPPLSLSPNNYSLENGHTNMAADDLATGTGVEDSDYALIAETDMNPVNSARNGSTYEDVPRLESTSGSRRPPQPAPRKSTKDTKFAMHPVHELYTTPDESQLSNGHRDSIPEYAVSQKFRKEPISQAVPQAPPSALGPEDINGLYTMPDKSRNMTKAKKVLDSDMDRPAGIDNALYICRGEDNLQEGETPNEYATDNDGMETGGEHESDGGTGMVENDLYETSNAPTGGDTGMVENDLYETSYRPT